MELNTRTVYSNYLQTCMLSGLPFVLKPFTTLNERFDIQAGIAPAPTVLPALKYMAIGNGGYQLVVGDGGKVKPEPIQHLATDASAFDPMPWVIREPANDLTPVERANYALRKESTINGTAYVSYYLRRIDLTGVLVTMEHRVVDETDNTTVTTPFVPDNSNLNPTPQDLDNSGNNILSGQYVSASAKVSVSITDWEASELLNVSKVLWNDEDYCIISEIQLCTGVDKTVSVNGSSGSFDFNEAIAVQVATHIAAFYPMQFSKNGIDIFLDIGASEPLWKIAST